LGSSEDRPLSLFGTLLIVVVGPIRAYTL
jgi:hypothetical protein